MREYKAMHEQHSLSSLLKEVGEDKKERVLEADRETKEEVSKKRTREGEKEENETLIVKTRCINPASAAAFDIFSQGEESESCGNSWGDLWDDPCGVPDGDPVTLTGVLVVSDVLVSSSSAVAEMCESDSDWECVEPQSFLSPKKRSIVWVENQEDMSYEGTPVKSTTDIQKEDDAAHATAELAFVTRGYAVAN